MKKILFSLFVMTLLSQSTNAQQLSTSEISDRMALKELVDTFSILADKKDTDGQRFLFTENATVLSQENGVMGFSLSGRQQIGDAFRDYLKNFETVYHINGQQTVKIEGDKATGTAYCSVLLIGVLEGKKVKISTGVVYNDEYLKLNGKWLINNRLSNFVWRKVKEIK